jgi:predicted metal-dependent hydrolase
VTKETFITDIDQLGKVLFANSTRAKRLSVTIAPFKPVRVAVPKRVSLKKAKKFLTDNFTWAKKQIEYVRNIEKQHLTTVEYNPPKDKKLARRILVSRLDELASRFNYKYNRVSIRNQKTLWASCSHQNNISLNIRLTDLSPELIDYVLLHELVHTKIKDHSSKFWQRLEKDMPDAHRLDRKLKKHHLGLQIPHGYEKLL